MATIGQVIAVGLEPHVIVEIEGGRVIRTEPVRDYYSRLLLVTGEDGEMRTLVEARVFAALMRGAAPTAHDLEERYCGHDATPGCDCDQANNPDIEAHAHDCEWRRSMTRR
jgi:hypothetical protein